MTPEEQAEEAERIVARAAAEGILNVIRQARQEALGNAEQIAANRAANTTDPREAAVASRIANDIKQLRE